MALIAHNLDAKIPAEIPVVNARGRRRPQADRCIPRVNEREVGGLGCGLHDGLVPGTKMGLCGAGSAGWPFSIFFVPCSFSVF